MKVSDTNKFAFKRFKCDTCKKTFIFERYKYWDKNIYLFTNIPMYKCKRCVKGLDNNETER